MIYKNIFYSFAEISGVKIFKKYYPIHGSFWNNYHINKNSIRDMKKIIENAEFFRKLHVASLFLSSMIIFGGYMMNVKNDQSKLMLIVCFQDLYTIMVQFYNINKAKDRIQYLEDNKIKEKEDENDELNNNQEIKIRKIDNNFTLEYLSYLHDLGPRLKIDDIKKWREFIYDDYNKYKETYSFDVYVYLIDFKQLFREFLEKNNKKNV